MINLLDILLRDAIPMTFDDSMSPTENLAAVVAKVNEIAAALNVYLGTDITTVIQGRLDEWYSDGTMLALVGGTLHGSDLSIADADDLFPLVVTKTAESVLADVGAKLAGYEQIVSVLAFGADPTGVLDSTAAFNLATRATEAYTGGNATDMKRTILVPPGDYLLEGTVYLRKGQHLKGAGIGASRLTIPVTNRAAPTFLMGSGFVDSAVEVDSGGLPPSISDLSSEGGSTVGAIYDCGSTAGASLFNLFITTAGKGVKASAGDLQLYNVVFDDCSIGIDIIAASRNVFTLCSFFHCNFSIIVTGSCYDNIISNSNFAFSVFGDIQLETNGDGVIKNLKINDCNFIGNGQYVTHAAAINLVATINADIKIQNCVFTNLISWAVGYSGAAAGNHILFSGCVVDGNKTHTEYTQGIFSQGITLGNNIIDIVNSHFKNLTGTYTILAGGTTGILFMQGCTQLNCASDHLIEVTSAGCSIIVEDCSGFTDLNPRTPISAINV